MFAFRTRHKEPVCKMGERFCEKDYSRTQEGKLVEHDPEAGGKKRGQGHQKRFGEERECVYLLGGQRCWNRLCKTEATGKQIIWLLKKTNLIFNCIIKYFFFVKSDWTQ